jgi:hypothetical protein
MQKPDVQYRIVTTAESTRPSVVVDLRQSPTERIYFDFSVKALFSPPKVVAFGRTIYRNEQPTIWGRPRVEICSTIRDKNEEIGRR